MFYWVISPGENAEDWDTFINEGIMGIGFECIGDLSTCPSKEALDETTFDRDFNKHYNDRGQHPIHCKCCWQFAKEIKIGDIVFAKDGIHALCGYGVVKSDYFYDKNHPFPHMRKVEWHQFDEEKHTDIYLDRKTLIELKDIDKIAELCELCGIKNQNIEP